MARKIWLTWFDEGVEEWRIKIDKTNLLVYLKFICKIAGKKVIPHFGLLNCKSCTGGICETKLLAGTCKYNIIKFG